MTELAGNGDAPFAELSVTFAWGCPVPGPGALAQAYCDANQPILGQALFLLFSELDQAGNFDRFPTLAVDHPDIDALCFEGSTDAYDYSLNAGRFRVMGYLSLFEYGDVPIRSAVTAAQAFATVRDAKVSRTFHLACRSLDVRRRPDHHRYDPVTGEWLTLWQWD